MKTFLLLLHPALALVTAGVLLWMIALLQTDRASYRSLKRLGIAVAICMTAIWIVAGYWYVVYYPADKAMVLHGKMPWAHTYFMETKEHLFLIAGILALYLPIAVTAEKEHFPLDGRRKRFIRNIAGALLAIVLFLDLAGAIVAQGAKEGLAKVARVDEGGVHERTF